MMYHHLSSIFCFVCAISQLLLNDLVVAPGAELAEEHLLAVTFLDALLFEVLEQADELLKRHGGGLFRVLLRLQLRRHGLLLRIFRRFSTLKEQKEQRADHQ